MESQPCTSGCLVLKSKGVWLLQNSRQGKHACVYEPICGRQKDKGMEMHALCNLPGGTCTNICACTRVLDHANVHAETCNHTEGTDMNIYLWRISAMAMHQCTCIGRAGWNIDAPLQTCAEIERTLYACTRFAYALRQSTYSIHVPMHPCGCT